MRARILLTVVSLTLLSFAPAPLPRKERQREDTTDVTGTWEFVVCEMRGIAQESIRVNWVIEMTRRQAVFVEKRGQRTVYPMHLDPTASPPSFTWRTGNRVGYVGSYRLQRDQITMIFEPGDRVADRPMGFAGKPMWKYVMRRVKRG